ncbi:acetamidase/formamidase family protein [Candidatus Bathyarchaeota archaeon]|nr:acetamidase/formamidase family protein [Candidatus Bathyarchaeota archaeon]
MVFRIPSNFRVYSFSTAHKPVLRVKPDSLILFEVRDAFDGQLDLSGDYLPNIDAVDRGRINPATGPVWIEEAMPGYTIEVEVLSVKVESRGFIGRRVFRILDDTIEADSFRIPIKPVIGVIGVAPLKGEASTMEQGDFGGNLDTPEITVGSRVFLPVWVEGGLLALGDVHAVQGVDEVFSGDALIDQNGEVLWRIDIYGHCDSSIFYRDREGRLILALAYEDGGFYFLDALTGDILREWHLGHGQGVNLASYRPDQPNGLANTFWGGAFWFIFSLEGEILHADFTDVYGWVPVNWSGDGVELVGSAYGLYDGYGRMVVKFPDPHHGKVWVYDVYGDKRDEVIVWNDKFLSIYTQGKGFSGIKIFTPKRKLYNQTFYGSFISEPDWTYINP